MTDYSFLPLFLKPPFLRLRHSFLNLILSGFLFLHSSIQQLFRILFRHLILILLILLSFMPGLEKHRAVYPLCMGLTALQSIAAALPLGAVSAAANALPLGSMGFGWVLPALAGLAGGLLLNKSDLQ